MIKIWRDLLIEPMQNQIALTSCPPDFHAVTLEVEVGKRYARIIKQCAKNKEIRSVHSFIDLANGDVLRPASWKKPAKHARGNIFDEWNGLKTMGPYGPAYLR